jgi:type I restriction enzyme, S subunit
MLTLDRSIFCDAPKEWRYEKISEILILKNGERPRDNSGKFPIYGANGIMGYSSGFLVDNDYTIIIGRVGASGEVHIAKGKVWVSDNAIYSNSYDLEKIHVPFLFNLLSFKNLRKYSTKTTHPIITQSFLNSLLIPLPPLMEQKKIAEILSTVDKNTEEVDRSIIKTLRLKKALTQELLTKGIGHNEFKETEIGGIPKEWGLVEIEEVTDINKELKDPRRELQDRKFFYIDIDSVENETGSIKDVKEIIGRKAPSRARREVRYSDVIMSTVRPYLKAFAIIPKIYDRQICSTGFAVLRCKEKILPRFLLYVLFSKALVSQFNRAMVGAQYPALNTSQVKRLKIPIPTILEQKEIAEILSTVDEKIKLLKEKSNKLERVKKGLMNDLLTGRRRVKVEA